jgi:DNA primase
MSRRLPASTPADIAERETARAAKLEALHATLTEQVASLRDGQDWRRWLSVACRFHQYSLNNVLLIAAQRPGATAVAGYGAWQALGRQVDKGEKGIAILAPILTRRSTGSDGTDTRVSVNRPSAGTASEPGPLPAPAPADDTAGSRGSVAGFRVAYVFDIAQTSGQPLPQQPTPQLLAGQAPQGLWDALAAQVTARGFTVRRGDCGPGVNGLTHYRDRTVTVRADVDDAQAVKSLAHELGHVLMHDPTTPTDLTSGATTGMPPQAGPPALFAASALTSAALCRGTVEVEAESVAYLIAASHGLDTGSYTFAYVAGWAATAGPAGAAAPEQVVRSTAGRVLAAARLVLAGSQPAAAADHGTAASTQAVDDLAAAQAGAADGARRIAALWESSTQTQHGVPRAGTYLASGPSADAAAHPAVPVAAVGPSRQTPAGPPGHGQIPRRGMPAVAAITAPPQTRLLQVHNLATGFYRARLGSGAEGAGARALLAERGVDASVAARAGLGYAPRGWTALVDHLRAAGVSDRELVATGLATTCSRGTLIDRFRDRVIFPVQDASGRTVALLGRAVDPTAIDRNGDRVPKYLNSPDTALYRKGEVLYGLGPARAALAAGAVPVLVEGPMDVLAIAQASSSTGASGDAGFVGVALCGTALTPAQVRLLEHATGGLAERGVVLAFDADDAGRHAAVRAFDLLREAGAWPHALNLPDQQDPADMLQQHGPAALHTALRASPALPLADLVIDQRIDRHAGQLRWAEGRIAAARNAAARIATFPPEHVARQVARLSARLELPADEVTSLLVEARSLSSDADIGLADSTDPRGQRTLQTDTRGARPLRAQFPTASPAVAGTRTAAQLARFGFPLPLQQHLQAPHRLPTPSTSPAVATRAAHSAPRRQV